MTKTQSTEAVYYFLESDPATKIDSWDRAAARAVWAGWGETLIKVTPNGTARGFRNAWEVNGQGILKSVY